MLRFVYSPTPPLLADGLTLRELAEALSVDLWHAHDLLRSAGVAVAQGPPDETAASLDAITADLR